MLEAAEAAEARCAQLGREIEASRREIAEIETSKREIEAAAREQAEAYLPYISPIALLHLPYISPISRLYLARAGGGAAAA